MAREIALFAGGCFWKMDSPFRQLNGVTDVTVGYTGGHTICPNYKEVCSGKTGHTEAVQIHYNPSIVKYKELLSTFWGLIDPTDPYGQFADRGSQYRTVIFFYTEEQKKLAENSKEELEKLGIYNKPIVTTIEKASDFTKAEDYHQQYLEKRGMSSCSSSTCSYNQSDYVN